MEQGRLNLIKKNEQDSSPVGFIPVDPLKNFSFIKTDAPRTSNDRKNYWIFAQEKSAILGLFLGVLAIVSWVVILFGMGYSIFGIIFSSIGLKSSQSKVARVGLALSIVGLILSAWYAFAAYQGMINYNYFTSDFWR